ncbi:cellulase family glycosylhydrolase [Kribbella qitaiheensis]|uniref:Endoglucanase n=1 Tax=Kribbella qitaiheensis TaxID=1544730 RepID=A0A7G6XA80_9ACTN|nr:cellulase family glycosylhydrolase [Kribbella qitaiheensis]
MLAGALAPHPSASAAEPTTAQAPTVQAAPAQDWLHAQGNKIVDGAGKEVWLTGANWFGFNASERVLHGLWSGNLQQITKSMADRGINVVRIPISAQLLLEWSNGQTIMPNVNLAANPDLAGLNNLQVFDRFLALCEQYGLKVFLDLHSAEADNSGHLYPLWYKGSITTESVYQAWSWVTTRYKTNDTIIGADLKNEPHGQFSEAAFAKWDDSTDLTNFKYFAETAAQRILAINPNLLIFVEGTEIYPKDGVSWTSQNKDDWYNNWWGGQLRGVAQHPINLGQYQHQLVYSPHDYGPLVYEQPWFTGDWNRTTLERDVWDPNWLYIHKQNIAPLLIGEWGGFLDGGRNQKWMTALRDLIKEQHLHHTYWVLNPNSGDTGGLLNNDWATWDEAKYALLKPALWAQGSKFVSLDHQVRLGGADSTTGISLSEATGGSGPVDTTAPSTPTALRAGTASSTSIPLSWTASTDNTGGSGIAGYEVYRGTTLVGTSAITSYTATGLTPSATYSFTVRARDVAGNVSASSAAVTATTAAGQATGACAIQYRTNDWNGGFTGTVRITNTGTTVLAGWTLRFTFPAGQHLLDNWSATWTQSGSTVSATSLSWNSDLAPAATIEIGFNATSAGTNTAPATFTLNNNLCTTT